MYHSNKYPSLFFLFYFLDTYNASAEKIGKFAVEEEEEEETNEYNHHQQQHLP